MPRAVLAGRLPGLGDEAGTVRSCDTGIGCHAPTVRIGGHDRLNYLVSRSSPHAGFRGAPITRIFTIDRRHSERNRTPDHTTPVRRCEAPPVSFHSAAPF